MKKTILLAIFFGVILLPSLGFGQVYVTSGAGNGNWSDPNSWTPVAPAGGPTAANSTSITVNHNLNFDGSITIDQTTISIGATVIVNNGITMTVGAGTGTDLNVLGSLTNNGNVTIAFAPVPPPPSFGTVSVSGNFNNAGTISGATSLVLTFLAGSTYDHQQDGGALPLASWNATSTCLVSGVTATAPTALNQSFGNFTWNCSGQTGYVDLAGNLTSIANDLSFLNTSTGVVYLTASNNYTLTVGQDLIIANSYVGFNSTATTATINITRDLSISNSSFIDFTFSGNVIFDINRHFSIDGGNVNSTYGGSANITINLAGDFQLSSTPTISNGGSGAYSLVFDGVTVQNYSADVAFPDFDVTVNNFAILDLGTSAIRNSNLENFTLQGGGTIRLGSLDGSGALQTGTTAGNIRVGGTRIYNAGGNIVYNGSGAQLIGNGFPGTAVNLEINNSAGVTNSSGASNIIGDLTLTSGAFVIGGSSSLNIQSDFFVTGGTISGSSTSDLTFSNSGSLGTLSLTSGAQTLRDLTIDRATTLVLGSDLTIVAAGDLALDNGDIDVSGFDLTINGIVSGGQGIITDNTSNITIGGSGAFGTIPIIGGNSLNNIVLSRTSGTYTISSAITIENSLDLNRGTLNNTGIIMADNTEIYVEQGNMTGSAPSVVSMGSYNVIYDRATGETIPGVELPTSGNNLNDLIVNTGGYVTLGNNVDIAGDLLLQSGEFRAGTNDVILSGTGAINDTGGSFTQQPTGTTIISGTTTLTNVAGIQFGGIEIASSGSLIAGSNSIAVQGDFDLVSGGNFSSGTGTVTFNGSASDIVGGSATFHNLSIASGSVLTASSGTTNVSGGFSNTAGTFIPNGGTINLTSSNTEVLSNASAFNNLTISGSGEYDLGLNLDVNGTLTLTSGTLDVTNSDRTISIATNWTNNGGTFNQRSGTVIFDGSIANIGGSSATTFNNLLMSNGTTRVTGTANLIGTLTMAASTTFDADGPSNTGVFTLKSSSGSDSRIAALGSGAVINGNLTFERYMPSYGSKRWRNIGSAVANATVSDLQNEISISGDFTGNNNIALGLTDPLTPPSIPSFAYYNESLDLGIDNNWVDFPASSGSNSETLTIGRGYSIYVRDIGAVTFDLRGTVNQGNISLPVSGTGSTPWNLVSNPYPSSIDWDNGSGWTRSNIQGDAIAVWNGLQYLTWNGSSGSLGNGRVPMGMAFWVQASNSSISLNINESAKTSTTGTVHREITPTALELSLTSIDYPYTDKAHIEFKEGAEMSFDSNDFGKLPNNIFNLATVSSDEVELSINSISNFVCGEEIPISITNLWVDTYRLNWSNVESIDPNIQIALIDKLTSEEYEMRSFNEAITVTVTTDSDIYDTLGTESNPYYTYQIKDRFSIVFREASFSTDLTTSAYQVCDEEAIVANLIIEDAEVDVEYNVYKDGLLVVSGIGAGADLTINLDDESLSEGNNSFNIKASRGGCNETEFTSPVEISIVKTPEVIYNAENNELTTNTVGDIQWYKNGEPIAGETGNTLLLDNFTATYHVSVSNDICSRYSEPRLITGFDEDFSNSGIELYPNPVEDKFYIKLDNSNFGSVLLRVHSSNGRLIEERTVNTNETEINASSYDNGIYMIEIIANNKRYVKRIVKQ